MPNRSRQPTHHEALISSKYEKALSIVQQLTASSGFQPSRDQKLQLYACYKQVNGDVDTPRPGIFDVIGRAKWDAWRNMSGTNPLAAKERYVNILLQVASEAFRKSGENEHARKILQALGSTKAEEFPEQPLNDSDSQDLSETDSENAEERAYLAEVQKNEMTMATGRPGPIFERSVSEVGTSRRPAQPKYARSLLDSTSMDKLRSQARPPPTNIMQRSRRSSQSSVSTTDNVRSRYHAYSVTSNQSNRRAQSTLAAGSQRERGALNMPTRNYRYSTNEDDLSGATKLWAQVPGSTSQLQWDEFDSDDSIEDERRATDASVSEFDQSDALRRRHLRSMNKGISPPRHTSTLPSQSVRGPPPSMGGRTSLMDSTASRQGRDQYASEMRDRAPLSPSISVVDLGPATKRALQSLQSEVIALNGRLDGLKSELLETETRDIVPKSKSSRLIASARSKQPSSDNSQESGDDERSSEGWKWVVKAAARHAVFNLLTTFIILVILYKRKSPIAATLSIQIQKYWTMLRRRVQ